jgi:hypothetical protein
MSASAAKDQFDWGGPASDRRPKSLVVKFRELFIPPKGEKVLPTGSGMILILVGLCLGLAAYNTENNILFAALSLLLGLIVMSGVFCWANLLCARWRLYSRKPDGACRRLGGLRLNFEFRMLFEKGLENIASHWRSVTSAAEAFI